LSGLLILFEGINKQSNHNVMKTIEEIIQLANLGVNITIDAGLRSSDELMQIAYIVNAKGSRLTILNASSQPLQVLKQMGQLLKSQMTMSF
jgi:hypothetical protein